MLIITLLLGAIAPSISTAQLALSIGSQGGDEVLDVSIYQDEITLVGSFRQALGSLLSQGGSDVFLQQYNLNGQLLWQYVMGSNSNDVLNSLTCSPSGMLYSAGLFRDSFYLEQDTVLYALQQGLFICKHNQQGALLWSKALEGQGLLTVNDIVSDALDNVYITGAFQDTFEVDASNVLNGGFKNQAFLIKIDANGHVVWAKQPAHTNEESSGRVLAIDAVGQLYWAGHFNDELAFLNDTFQAHWVYNDFFLTLIDTQANVLWARQYGGVYDNQLNQMRWANGALYLGGNLKGVLDIDTIRFVTEFRDRWDGFVAKLNPDGTAIWGSQTNTRTDCIVEDVVLGTDAVIVCGNFSDSLTWNGSSVVGTDGVEAFQMAMNDQGQEGQLKAWKGNAFDLARANALHSSEQVVTVGAFRQDIAIEGTTLQANGFSDGFLTIQPPVVLPNGIPYISTTSIQAQLLPNPATNFTKISLETGDLIQWMLYNNQGQVVLNGRQTGIFIQELPAGVYTLKIQSSKGFGLLKLIKTNG